MSITWDSPVTTVVGKQGRKLEPLLQKKGIETVGDLLRFYPRAYVPKGRLSELGQLVEGTMVSLVGEIVRSSAHEYRDRRTGRIAYRLEVVVQYDEGRLLMTYFDRQKHTAEWRARLMARGRTGMFSGKLKLFRNEWQLTNPDSRMWEDGDNPVEMPDLIPIYAEVGAVSTWTIEETIAMALSLVDRIPDPLPSHVAQAADLISPAQAFRWVHRPDDFRQLGAARKRIKYDEAFVVQTILAQGRAEIEGTSATPRTGRKDGILTAFDAALPFELTEGQRDVGEEIAGELGQSHPMHRLLQGEVGSGKTMVALRAMLRVVDSGGQAALLAPTEVLAQQHQRSIEAMLGPLAQAGTFDAAEHATRVTLLTGSLNAAQRRQALADAASGEAGIVIGTHALLEDKVQFADLGLVVVDEQHRFGVEQRAALGAKAEKPPHVLVMTATPIPRTVAMTVFGDLETSTLSQLPAGRGEVQTSVVPEAAQPAWLDRAWQRIREEVQQGHQAYVVCPRIDIDPDEPGTDERPLRSVEEMVEELSSGFLQGLRIEGLHGRMAPEDKDAVMRSFAAGEVDVLVSTTVIEVGVDVPNATVMVILDAERFGVSQLHQLRGRIGRGGHHGLCLLVSGAEPESPSMARLFAVAATRDGFELSRVDLEQRREGNILGSEQSGKTLHLLSVLDDEDVIVEARETATQFVADDPDLASVPDLRDAIRRLQETGEADYLEMG